MTRAKFSAIFFGGKFEYHCHPLKSRITRAEICVLSDLSNMSLLFFEYFREFYKIFKKIGRFLVGSVGIQVAKFISYLYENEYIFNAEQINIVGHSLGAHNSGLAAKHLYLLTKQKVSGISISDEYYLFTDKILQNVHF
jgi:hypothetical protein